MKHIKNLDLVEALVPTKVFENFLEEMAELFYSEIAQLTQKISPCPAPINNSAQLIKEQPE